MEIVMVVLKWRPYLLGRHFIIRTDQWSLKFLLERHMIGIEYHKWVCKLLGFDFEIQYKAGHLNQAADALSQRPVEAAYASLMTSQCQDWDKLKTELDKDDFLQRLMLDLSQGTMAHSGFELRDGLLFFKGRLVVPRTSSLIPLILTKFHSTLI